MGWGMRMGKVEILSRMIRKGLTEMAFEERAWRKRVPAKETVSAKVLREERGSKG